MQTCATGKGLRCSEASPWGASQVAQGSGLPCAPHDQVPPPRNTQGPTPQHLRRPPMRRCGQRWAKDKKSVEEGTPVPALGSKKRSGGEAEEGGAASLAQKRHKELSAAPGGATAVARWGCCTSHAAAKQPAFGSPCATRCEHSTCLPTPAQPQGPTCLPSPAHARTQAGQARHGQARRPQARSRQACIQAALQARRGGAPCAHSTAPSARPGGHARDPASAAPTGRAAAPAAAVAASHWAAAQVCELCHPEDELQQGQPRAILASGRPRAAHAGGGGEPAGGAAWDI